MMSVLVVDDDPDICLLMGDVLDSHGIHVAGFAKNGKEAVEMCFKLCPDVMLLDVCMPEYDGIYALERISQLKRRPKTIMITGSTSQDTKDRIEKFGPAAILEKPANIETLMELITS